MKSAWRIEILVDNFSVLCLGFRCLLASQSVGGSQSSNLFPWVPQVWLKFDYGRWNATLKGFSRVVNDPRKMDRQSNHRSLGK